MGDPLGSPRVAPLFFCSFPVLPDKRVGVTVFPEVSFRSGLSGLNVRYDFRGLRFLNVSEAHLRAKIVRDL